MWNSLWERHPMGRCISYPVSGFHRQWQELRQRATLVRIPSHSQCCGSARNAPCKNRMPPLRMERDRGPVPEASRTLHQSNPDALRPGRSGRCLPLQRRFQDGGQLFATSGSPPQNTQTGLPTQIVFFRHFRLQDLRQGRCGVFAGELPNIARREFCTQRSIRLPCKGRRRAIVPFQA